MTHSIENNKNSLANLLVKVQDQASRNADYLAPLKDLQKTTTDTGKPQIVVEQSGGVPTQFFDINDVSFGQIASHAEIDTRTARRLQASGSVAAAASATSHAPRMCGVVRFFLPMRPVPPRVRLGEPRSMHYYVPTAVEFCRRGAADAVARGPDRIAGGRRRGKTPWQQGP